MTLSHEEERAFRELHQHLDDVRRAFRRCYIVWHARFYGMVSAAVVGATLIACEPCWWPLAVVGSIITVSSFVLAFVVFGRLAWPASN